MADEHAPVDVSSLVSDHHEAVYRYAYRLSGSAADAEDLTQQVFLIAQQKLAQLRDPAGARYWLFAILRNSYFKELRRPAPMPMANLDLDINLVPEEVLEKKIDAARLQAAIDQLPDQFKVVLLMFYFEQRHYREIAEQLDLPLGTVMSRLARAKAHLRRRLFEDESLNKKSSVTSAEHAPSQGHARPIAIKR